MSISTGASSVSASRAAAGLPARSAGKRPWPTSRRLASAVELVFASSICARSSVVGGDGQAQTEREGGEPLLCAVVEVTLEPVPLGIARGDHARRDSGAPRAETGSSACSRSFSSARRAALATSSASVGSRAGRPVREEGDRLAPRTSGVTSPRARAPPSTSTTCLPRAGRRPHRRVTEHRPGARGHLRRVARRR